MRILLADDQSKVRFALRTLLEQLPRVDVVGEAADAGDLLDQAQTSRPDLVLLGWELRGLPAAALLNALRRVCPDVYVIALSSRPEERRAVLETGANAFVSKIDSPQRLLVAIDQSEK
jgi:DNA-binding NarL/FixJ family response regulator